MTDRIDEAIRNAELTRRHFLVGSAMVGFAAFLAACGSTGQGSPGPTSGTSATSAPGTAGASAGPATALPAPTGGGTLNFANWIGYIDITDDQQLLPDPREVHRRDRHRDEYQEGRRRQRDVLHRRPPGPARRRPVDRLGPRRPSPLEIARLARLHGSRRSTRRDAELHGETSSTSTGPIVDRTPPRRAMAVGDDGIGHDAAITGPLDSLESLRRHPQWRMTYLSEMRTRSGSRRSSSGTAGGLTEEQFQEAIGVVDAAVKAGIPRSSAGNSYVDTSLRATPTSEWLVRRRDQPAQPTSPRSRTSVGPAQGRRMLWTDKMCIPKGAENKGQAEI